MKYYGIFKKIYDLNLDELNDIDLYEGYFAERYDDIIGNYTKEKEIYIGNAFSVDGKVLEIACGSGRIIIDLAKRGFNVKGIDYSIDMLKQLENKLKKCTSKIKNRIEYEQGDIFNYSTDEKYKLIIIPATTICLMSEDFNKLVDLFKNIYEMLDSGGRFIFDYRIDQDNILKECSQLEMRTIQNEKYKEFIMFQEFDNYIPGYSTVNFYAERIYSTHTERYMASSRKKIVTDKFIKKIIAETDFKVFDEDIVELSGKTNIKYITLCKEN